MPRSHRLLKAAVASAALLLILAGGVLAQGVLGEKLRTGDAVTIAAGETVPTDLYAFAGTVSVDGTIDGDLVASGGTIDVTGTVNGDVLAAGGTINISGTVGGDVRIAGGTVTISGAVTEDLLATGGQVTVASTGTVGQDMIAGAGQLTLDGAVTGSVVASAGTYTKGGTIGGTEDVTVTGGQGAQPIAERTATQQVLDAVRHFLVVLLAGILLIWLAPRAYAAMKSALQQRPLPAAGWGIVGLFGYIVLIIVVVILMILLAVVFGLLGFGDLVGIVLLGGIVVILAASLAFAIVTAYVADALVGAALAGLVVRDRAPSRSRELAMLAVGAAVVVVVTSLPIVGSWIKLVVMVLGLGAVLLAMQARRTRRPADASSGWVPPPETPAT
jgi:cytoskeletal protein CcmA (bactofilin family)